MEGESVEHIAKYAAVFMGYEVGDGEQDKQLHALISEAKTMEEKVAVFNANIKSFDSSFIFPFSNHVSEVFQNDAFQYSFLEQPAVWIKMHKGFEKQVLAELQTAGIPFEQHEEKNVLSFQSEAKLTDLKSYKEGYFRIQDLSSQQTAEDFKPKGGENWWDCCAGAGGKSLALLEKEPKINLYASDIRESILNNLYERLPKAAQTRVNIFAIDVTESLKDQKLPAFDGIVLDAPCSGSGTWARNPENLVYFEPDAISDYQQKQLAILNNVYPLLKTDKPLIYITCSVFKEENEEVITRFAENHEFDIEEQKYLEGYKHGSENMFLCRMIKRD